ncbi:ATP synthase-coupling factor 6 [Schistosoma japonicum]|uniref:ATP synthase-coupling factor 6 n=2 Tax=Schistosoma japonicum TaxID=6182 RepID=Q5DB31_SCHJA|nr:SJCHGC05665 protein [Schistosoma japonicum]TNN17264.1 ATP synthase-coupling factor 6 [Schistosoma japonicum]CAX74440.1 ATPase, F0 complex, subunit F6, mitochondrial,domain-containing protein [Schistosoma japonicum]CAX74441.1 ATPase, F0 complex, subunit F6, mitochondrial,domain-containing protein [Schistosoma japonicum]
MSGFSIAGPVLHRVCRMVINQRCLCDAAGASRVKDPIQLAFISKLREYRQKSEKSEVGLADASPKEIKELNEMLAKVDRIYGAESDDMTQFPVFKFEDPSVVIPTSSLRIEYPDETENAEEVNKHV